MAEMDTMQVYELPEEEHGANYYLRRIFTTPAYFLFLVAIVVLFILLRDHRSNLPTFWVVVAILIMLFFVYKSFEWLAKHQSPKLIVNQMYTTTIGRPITRIGAFDIWSMGDIFVSWFPPIQGKEGSLIVPSAARNNVGRCIVYPVRVWKKNFYELPIEMQQLVAQFGLQRDNVYMGLIDDTQVNEEVDLTKIDIDKFRVLDDKILDKLSRLKKVPAQYLANIFLEGNLNKNAFWWMHREASAAAQTLASDIRRIGDRDQKSPAGRVVQTLLGEDDERKRGR